LHLSEEIVLGFPLPLLERDRVRGCTAVLQPPTSPHPDLPPRGAFRGRFLCQAAFGAGVLHITGPLRLALPSCPRKRASRLLACGCQRVPWIPACAGMTTPCNIRKKPTLKAQGGEGTRVRSAGDETPLKLTPMPRRAAPTTNGCPMHNFGIDTAVACACRSTGKAYQGFCVRTSAFPPASFRAHGARY